MEKITMLQAKAQGKTRYYTGKPCPQGHIAERIVSTRACSQCTAEKKHRWNKENPDKVAALRRKWVAENPEKAKECKSAEQKRNRAKANERNRRYAAQNREQLRVKNALWATNNPDKVAAKVARRRAVKLNATPSWADHAAIERAYELAQEYRAKGINAEVDHIIPLQGKHVCGLHVQGNLQIVSMAHNRSKSNLF